MKKNTKRTNLQKITDINLYQQRALLWTKYEHSYNKVHKAVVEGKVGSFMRTSHVRVYAAKKISWIHNLRNQKNQKFKILPCNVQTASITVTINMISTINLAEAHGKIHFPIISGGIEIHYLCYSEEGCSRKISSCSNNDFPRNRRFLPFGWEGT